MLDTPVVMLVFARPDLTAQVFERVREQRPKTLLVVADAARTGKAGEEERVRQTRAIFGRIDWPCERLTHYAECNLGCGPRVSSGITWAFTQVERAIILEDDCLPRPAFFGLCDDLLRRYADEPRVGGIYGYNPLGRMDRRESHVFIRQPLIWGWGTWRRAWAHYDFEMRDWLELRRSSDAAARMSKIFRSPREQAAWTTIFDRMAGVGSAAGSPRQTWDYQWAYACFKHNLLAAVTTTNLVDNLGVGPGATHTSSRNTLCEVPSYPQIATMRPREVALDADAEARIADVMHPDRSSMRSRTRRLRWRLWIERRYRLGF